MSMWYDLQRIRIPTPGDPIAKAGVDDVVS
jgi:hypothetical protein